MFSFHNLTKSYGSLKVLDRVSGRLEESSITAVIGSNGAGKSTLLNLLGRLLEPEEGEILLDGKALKDWQTRSLAQRLSVLKQYQPGGMNLTVEELVTMGRFPYSRGFNGSEDRAHIDEALSFCHLEHLRDRPLYALSGGQRQRVFIALVVAQDTDILLLDEPFNNLDLQNSLLLMDLLRELAHDRGKTIGVVMHDINRVSALADRVCAVKDQGIYFDGPIGDFMRKEHLNSLFGVDFEILEHKGRSLCLYY